LKPKPKKKFKNWTRTLLNVTLPIVVKIRVGWILNILASSKIRIFDLHLIWGSQVYFTK